MTAVQLPEASDAATRARLRRRRPEAVESVPPPELRQAIAGVVELLEGGRPDLSAVTLDFAGIEPFECRVYERARAIAPGQTTSYGALAQALGEPGAARAVGQALGHNPFPILVPCHRVLAGDGGLGGFSAAGGTITKRRMLRIEGAEAARQGQLFDD